jgi:dynein heavy chain
MVVWTTAAGWFKQKEAALSGDFNAIDAPAVEKFVEDGMRTLAVAARYFKDRDLIAINKIAENVRENVDEFRPKVPLLVALRKTGMKDRHWAEIS